MRLKIIKAQYSLPYNHEEDIVIRAICSHINKDIEGWPIFYDCGEAEYKDEDIIFIEVRVEANTFKDCEALLKLFKDSVKKNFNRKVTEILKAKLEQIY